MRLQQLFFYLIPAILFVGISACNHPIEGVPLVVQDTIFPVQTVYQSKVMYSEEGEVKVKLSCGILHHYEGEEPITKMDSGVELLFFDSLDEVTSKLTSIRATMEKEQTILRALDSVVVVNIDGDILETDELIWEKSQRKIYSDKWVKVTTPDEVIFGNGLVANEDFTNYTVKKIRGIINLKDEAE